VRRAAAELVLHALAQVVRGGFLSAHRLQRFLLFLESKWFVARNPVWPGVPRYTYHLLLSIEKLVYGGDGLARTQAGAWTLTSGTKSQDSLVRR
jgi:hypothetical protein